MINVQNPKLSDLRVRQAIRYAIDVPALTALSGLTSTKPAYALISEDMGVGYWPEPSIRAGSRSGKKSPECSRS